MSAAFGAPASTEIRVLGTPAQLFEAAAAEFGAQASQAVAARGRFTVALSGGSTPRALYSLLATRTDIPWDRICFFWGDERHVPPDHPDSNYRMVQEALLSKVPAPAENIFRVHSENKDAHVAARQYEEVLQKFFQLPPGQFPRFDLILLGIGPDGHTASLFPGSAGLRENQHLVIANWVQKFNSFRITFTLPVLDAAACLIFLASGPDKAPILREILENPAAGLPSQQVRPWNGRLLWMIDAPAASQLSRPQGAAP